MKSRLLVISLIVVVFAGLTFVAVTCSPKTVPVKVRV